MTEDTCRLLFCNVDYTLVDFNADYGYEVAAIALAPVLDNHIQPVCHMLREQFANLLHGNGNTRSDVEKAFREHIRHDRLPEEAMWCRTAAFLSLIKQERPRMQNHAQTYLHRCIRAETAFWDAISDVSRRYGDVDELLAKAVENGAIIQPITSSDVRVVGNGTYSPLRSKALKLARLERVFRTSLPRAIVFEEYAKASKPGWHRYGRRYTPDQIRSGAILGDSPGDIAAGLLMGMRKRIFLDRGGLHNAVPTDATHLVRSLSEVPAILGW